MVWPLRRPTVCPGQAQLLECLCHLMAAQLKHVLGISKESVVREQSPELPHFVKEARLEPVLAVELVLLDVGEHKSRESEQFVEGRPGIGVEQRSVLLREALALGRQLLCRAFDVAPVSERIDVTANRRERKRRIIKP